MASPLRILLSEGSSTSAREALTALGLQGHHVELCDPDSHCIARFSRHLAAYHRCPGLRDDPVGFLNFVCDLLARRKFDVLLPIHEQGYLFARAQARLHPLVKVALPSFESYQFVHGKAGFSRLLDELCLAQPETVFVKTARELEDAVEGPCVIKASVGTASRGTWIVRKADDVARTLQDIATSGALEQEMLVQELVPGAVEHAQAVFCRGRLVACHVYAQVTQGAGGGDAIKESVSRPVVKADLARVGERLGWHGALSVDYILRQDEPASGDIASGIPVYIDCNPRLVEPMSAALAGLDLAGMLVKVSLGESPQAVPDGRAGTRTHLGMQALLGLAVRGGSRAELLAEIWRLLTRGGAYEGSAEELTPVRLDWPSAVPLMATALSLLASPRLAHALTRRGWGSHLLTPGSIRLIEQGIPVACSR